MDTQTNVIKCISVVSGVSENKISADSTLESLSIDSLDFYEVVMMLEEEYEIEINDDDMDKLKTVADIVAYLEKAIA